MLIARNVYGINLLLNILLTLTYTDDLPSIVELLRVLVNVLDPNDQQHTDSTRLIALGILNAALEESGPCVMEFPSLEALIFDPGCKFLFQLARSDNTAILYSSLRAIATVFDTMRKHLKALSHYATSSRICESLLVLFSLGFRVHILIPPNSLPSRFSHCFSSTIC